MDSDTARMIQLLQEQLDGLHRYLGHDREAYLQSEKYRELQAKIDGYRKEMESAFRQQFEDSGRYFNTVMTVGYAGYFAAWTLTREHLDQWHTSFVGLMGLLSLAAFIVWELLMMHFRMQNLAAIQVFFRNMVAVEDFEPLRQERMAKETQLMMFFRPIWAIVFVWCCATAALGAGDLMIQLARNLHWVGASVSAP